MERIQWELKNGLFLLRAADIETNGGNEYGDKIQNLYFWKGSDRMVGISYCMARNTTAVQNRCRRSQPSYTAKYPICNFYQSSGSSEMKNVMDTLTDIIYHIQKPSYVR